MIYYVLLLVRDDEVMANFRARVLGIQLRFWGMLWSPVGTRPSPNTKHP